MRESMHQSNRNESKRKIQFQKKIAQFLYLRIFILCLENSSSQSYHKQWERSLMDGKPMRSQIKNTI